MGGTKRATIHLEDVEGQGVCAVYGGGSRMEPVIEVCVGNW